MAQSPSYLSDNFPRAEITNEVIRIHRDYFGKGPERAKVYVNDDVVFCLLENTSTPVEQALADGGRSAQALYARTELLQDAFANALCPKIEELADHKVRGFTAGHSVECDTTTLTFLLDTQSTAQSSPDA